MEGIPQLKMPDVCTESPAHGKAFCSAQCEYLLNEALGVPTRYQEFLKYCEVVTEGTYNNILTRCKNISLSLGMAFKLP